MSETLDDKAKRYLAEGKVKVLEFSIEDDEAKFGVTGSVPDAPYTVWYRHGDWACDCPARVPVCAHILATRLICSFVPHRNTSLYTRDTSIDEILGLA